MKTTSKIATLTALFAASIASTSALAETITLPSGVIVAIEGKSTGAKKPTAASTVSVHYEGSLTDGKVFDSSYKRGAPATFPLSRVIPCWTQGVSAMSVGDKAILTCPANTAYGASGIPGTIPGNAVLKFKVELLAIQ